MNILRRSCEAHYTVPDAIKGNATSEELKDLLAGMLQPDPEKRFTVSDVWNHPWFRIGLPPAAETFSDKILATRRHAGWQTEAEILEIFSRAEEPPPSALSHDEEAIMQEVIAEMCGSTSSSMSMTRC